MLLLPLVAMQFTDEVNWSETDFIVAGALIGGTGLTFELAARATVNHAYRAAVGLALAAAFLLIWLNLAVGIIGTEENPLNLIFGAVLATGIIGAIIVRCRPLGMARAMLATALAQLLVAVIAPTAGVGLHGADLAADRLLRRAVARVGLAVSESGARASPASPAPKVDPLRPPSTHRWNLELRRDRQPARTLPHHPGIILGRHGSAPPGIGQLLRPVAALALEHPAGIFGRQRG